MTTPREAHFITTAIPYVNASPHIGFAMELVLADVLARHQRLRGRDVRLLTGSDDNSLKNVRAAEAAGVPTAAFVDRNAAEFRALWDPLALSFDDFLRTSSDRRHRDGVERLWRACAAHGDITRRFYRGLYCVGCEQFYREADLESGRCPEHDEVPELVEEENYFFRLSRYGDAIDTLLRTGELRVSPEPYRRELLAFVERGLEDFSISRTAARARGWGIPVPGDPGQVMYVWFDALGNYITALDYGSPDAPLLSRYWRDAARRVHVIGKGVSRFHGIYWPAMLRSAGLPTPTDLVVHGYLTVDGRKISKSLGNTVDPVTVVSALGADAVRYYLCRHISAGRDGDFSLARVAAVRRTELADQLGNLLRRTTAMIARYCEGRVPTPRGEHGPFGLTGGETRAIQEQAFAEFRPELALRATAALIEQANRYVVREAPWRLAKDPSPSAAARLETVLYTLAEGLRLIAYYLLPFTPQAAHEIHRQLGVPSGAELRWEEGARWGVLAPGTAVVGGPQLFPKD